MWRLTLKAHEKRQPKLEGSRRSGAGSRDYPEQHRQPDEVLPDETFGLEDQKNEEDVAL